LAFDKLLSDIGSFFLDRVFGQFFSSMMTQFFVDEADLIVIDEMVIATII